MKRHSIFLTISILTAVAFSGCELFEEELAESLVQEVKSGDTTIKLEKIPEGKTLYLAKVNTGMGNVDKDKTKSITSFTGNSNRSILINEIETSTSENNSISNEEYTFTQESFRDYHIHHYPKFKNIKINKRKSSARTATELDSIEQSFNIGDEFPLNVETSYGYTQKTARLRAKGTNCYVWVINDYFSDTDASKVSSSRARTFATKFDALYPMITNIYGKESDYLYEIYYATDESTGRKYEAIDYDFIENNSVTGKKINIVICDIPDENTMGKFSSKDYYFSYEDLPSYESEFNSTNYGKYFYIDYKYAISNLNETLSTLAHEFAHMVSFYQKNTKFYEYETTVDPLPTAIDEMLSMLCEDMMQSYLGITDKESPKGRLQNFNANYYLSGILQFNENNRSAAYSNAYAFGAWLCRQYGGADFIKKVMTNKNTDETCLSTAANTSIDNLMTQFMNAILGSSEYTMNKKAQSKSTYGNYSYPMTAINIFSTEKDSAGHPVYGIAGSKIFNDNKNNLYSDYDGYGPMLFKHDYTRNIMGQYGFTLHGIAKTSELISKAGDSITVNFSSGDSDNNVKMYLIIQ